MKVLALDIGDKWTGIAISDVLGMFARPLETVETNDLDSFLKTFLWSSEDIKKIVIGFPKTMKGSESLQTKATIYKKTLLEKKFESIEFVLWDERLSSKRANTLQKNKGLFNKESKNKSHSVAAALILQSYLDYLATKVNC